MTPNSISGTTNSTDSVPIYFIRHGIAEHNIRNCNYSDPRYINAKLTEQGVQQVHQMANLLTDYIRNQNQRIGLLLVSPLFRCLQTSEAIVNAFHSVGNKNFDTNINDDSNNHPLLNNNTPTVPVVIDEELREVYGIHFSDQRGTLSEVRRAFPYVHIPSNLSECDTLWKPNQRETVSALQTRIQHFVEFVLPQYWKEYYKTINANNNTNDDSRSRTPVIVCVTHGVWMECCMQMYSPNTLQFFPDEYSGAIRRMRVYNANVFTGVYYFQSQQQQQQQQANSSCNTASPRGVLGAGMHCIIK